MMWVARRKAGFLSKKRRTKKVGAKLQGAEISGEAAVPDRSDVFVHIDGADFD